MIESRCATPRTSPALRTDRAADLGYVVRSGAPGVQAFWRRLPVIGFCGAPFTLASYMIEGGGSRNYIHTKKMMYSSPHAWDELMAKLVAVTVRIRGRAGARRRRRDPDLRQLGRLPERRGLSPLRFAAHHRTGEEAAAERAFPSFISAPTAPPCCRR